MQHYQADGLSKERLLTDLVDGMNYTPAQPMFEEMRDGILTGLELKRPDQDTVCAVWDAFAQYGVEGGVGVGAVGVVRGKRVAVSESFAVPSACTAP